MEDKILLGSRTAKNGFKTEKDVVKKFNNWKRDNDAKCWLQIMNYNLKDIDYVSAEVINKYKADVSVRIQVKLKKVFDVENIQVKLVSNKKGFNQIDKRFLDKYDELWQIPEEILNLFKYFTGEYKPYIQGTKSSNRMFITEFSEEDQAKIINWIDKNKYLIISDILRGRGEFAAEWVLVLRNCDGTISWTLQNINKVMTHYFSDGNVVVSPKGSIKIGKVTMQRKGGDGGRHTATMLQFKIDPTEIFNI